MEDDPDVRQVTLLPVRADPAAGQDLVVLADQLVRAMFGATAVAAEVVLRALGDSLPQRTNTGLDRADNPNQVVGVVLGTAWQAATLTGRALAAGRAVVRPVVRITVSPPLLPSSWTPKAALDRAAAAWADGRPRAMQSLTDLAAAMAPATTDAAVQLIDVDDLLRRAMTQVKLQPLAEAALAQLDLDQLLAQVVADLDVGQLVETALADVDLTLIVRQVMEHIDLEATVDQALDEIDLTALVLQRVDLNQVINSALAELDLTSLVLEKVDLVRVTNHLVDEVDLPDLIRESTRSIAAETVEEVRLQSADADRAVSRLVARVLRRPVEQP